MIEYCPHHSYIKIDTWEKSKDLARELMIIGKPALQTDCPDCVDMKNANEVFQRRCRDTW